MDADWSVELGTDEPALEFPWSSPDGTQHYIDLSKHPDQLAHVVEAVDHPALRKVLLTLNGPSSPWLTAKCDVWLDEELGEAEQIYDAGLKLCSYIDLIRRAESERYSFEQHEHWAKRIAQQLQVLNAGDKCACELIVRRCWYHTDTAAPDDLAPGFHITVYVSGYGDNKKQAGASWSSGLTGVISALGSPNA